MIKRYCDCCGDEITESNLIDGENWRLKGELKKPGGTTLLCVEVITGKNNAWNDGDFCKYCVIDAINKSDDRPRAKAAT